MKNKGKRKLKNILSVALALTMLLTAVPMSVSAAAAEELSETTEKVSDAVKSAGASLGYMLLDAATELGRQNLQQTSIVNDMINSTQNSIFTAAKAVEKKITDIVTDGIYGDFEYTILDNGTAEITGYNGSTSNLEIPLKVDGYTVTIIGYEAFANCNFITDVKIPDSVISIYESAFADCESLVNVSIGNNVSDIAFNAFNGCTLLTCITLPASIKNVEAGTFFGCTSLANIKVNPDNTVYSDVNGVLFNKDKTKIVKYPQGKQDTNYVIPSSVKVIAESSFSGCKALENVTIPDSVNSIESWAFKDTGIYNNSKNWEKGVLYIDKWLVSGEQYFYNELSVKDGIYGIADKAFSDCSVLTNVIFPSSLLYIGNNAFENCSLITDIKANSCIDTIGKAAFSGCCSLTFLNLPCNLVDIGEHAFSGCSSLQVVKIDGNVDCIGEAAFSGCDALDTVTVSGNVGSIGDYAFNNCDLLTNVTIDGDLKKIGRNSFADSGFAKLTINGSIKEIENDAFKSADLLNIKVGGNIINIETYAFSGCNSLKEIEVSGNVNSIGYNAFSGCNSLISVKIGGNLKNIGESAFFHCDSLTTVSFSGDIENIESCAFNECNALTEFVFPGNVDNIGYGVFADCVSLLTVKVNGNVGNISKEAFAGCISLKSIEVNGNIENISEFAFSDDGIGVQSPYCTILESVKINGYIGNIGKSAFFKCSSLKNIGALGGIRNIEDKAFAYCASLVNIECNADMENIGESAFCGCSSLKTVTIKGGVEFISDYAFSDSSTYNPSYCISLENVKIDGDIGTLGLRAFFNCSKLNNIEVGGNITNICDETFSDCNSLINITIHGNINSLNSSMFIGCNLLKNVEIAGNVEKICKSTFSENCSNLEKVIIGGNVGAIETYAFYKCGNLLSIEINGDVGNIGESAFSQCNLLKNVEIAGDVGDIGSYAFSNLWSGCSGLENVKIGGSVNSFGDSVFFKSSLKIIEIGGSVGVIGDDAFRECVDLEAFKVGEDINSIGKMAFNGCTSLKSVDVHGNVGGIGNIAFEDCDALTDVAFGGNVGDIEKEAFYGCDALNSIIFSGNVGNIKEKAFYACESLESIKIQGDVESIGTSAFSKCISLTDMVILGSVSSIGNRAFSECSKIREFVIPTNVTSIESGTFENCASLSSVTLPSSLISIGENAFYKCSSLRDIYYGGTKKEWENIDKAASRLPSNVTVHYNSNGEEAILSNYYVGTVEDAWYGGEDNSETWVKIDGIDYQVWNQISVVIYPDFIKGKQIAYILDEQNRVTKYVLVSDAKIGRVKNYNPENNTLEIENETGGCYLQDGITNANVLEKAGLLPGKLIRYTTVSVGKSVDGLIAFGLVDAELVETFAGKITTLDVLSDPWQVYLEGYDRTFPVNMAQPGLQDQLISLQNAETVITLLDGRICYVYGVEELFKVECSPSGNFSEEGPVGTILWKDDRYLDEPLNFDVSIGCSIADIIGDQKVVEQYMAGRSLYLDKIKLHTDLDILEPSEQIIKVNQFLYINQTNQISVEFKIKKGLHDAPKEESSWETIGIDFLGNDWNKAGFGRVSIVNEDLIAENEKKRQEAEEAFQEEADIAAKIAGEAFKRFKQNAEMQARECITLPGELASYLNEEEAQALRVGIAARIILAKMQSNGFIAKLAEMGIDKIVSEKVFDLLMKWSYGDWQFDVSAKKIQIPVAARIETAKHGTIYVEMTCDIQNFDLKDSTFGTWGTIYVDKLTVEKNKNPISVPGNGIISIADMSGFADGVEDVALAQAGKAVNEIRKDNLNKMVVTELAKRISSFYFEEAIEDIVQYVVDEHLSESAVRIICTAEKIMGVHCPVDLYLYNVDGELAGSIVNSQVYTEDENLDMWTDGDSKYIRILDGTYNVVYEARGNGEMKVEILERGSADLDWRTVVFDKVPLVTGNLYTSSLDDKLDADYTLVSCNGDVIEPDEVIDNYPDEPSGIPGDLNGDGKVTAVDARWVLQIAAGTREVTEAERISVDLNGDGKVTAVDARWVLQVAAGTRVL